MADLDPKHYTILWLAPLEVEAQAAAHMLDNIHDGSFSVALGQDYVFEGGDIHGHNVVIATLGEGQPYGTSSASSLANQAKTFFTNLRCSMLVGVAAGLPDLGVKPPLDIRLGDVLVATPGPNGGAALVAYDLGRVQDDGFELLRQGHVLDESSHLLMSAIGKIKRTANRGPGRFLELYKTLADKQHSYGTFADPGEELDCLYALDGNGNEFIVPRDKRCPDQRSRVWYGPIGTGEKLMKNAKVQDILRESLKTDRIIGLEMEAAGMMNSLRPAVIRGVSDYADRHKNWDWQPFAAAMAASYAKAVIYELGWGKDVKVVNGTHDEPPRLTAGSTPSTVPVEVFHISVSRVGQQCIAGAVPEPIGKAQFSNAAITTLPSIRPESAAWDVPRRSTIPSPVSHTRAAANKPSCSLTITDGFYPS